MVEGGNRLNQRIIACWDSLAKSRQPLINEATVLRLKSEMMDVLLRKDTIPITTCPNFTVTHTIITSTGKHHDTGYQTLKSRTSITGRMRIQMERQNLRCLEVYT